MTFNSFNAYNDSYERAFEALCNQLFERWVHKEYSDQVKYFTTVNGAGGDGGVEAYAIVNDNKVIGIQAKWFRDSIDSSKIAQIKKSILTAKGNYSSLIRYIVCVPRNFSPNKKRSRGGQAAKDYEEKRINDLIAEIKKQYDDLQIEFWPEDKIREELQQAGNEGIRRFWFEKEEISIEQLKQRFALAKAGWMKERYVPALHSCGKIQEAIEEILFTSQYRKKEIAAIYKVISETEITRNLIDDFNQLAGSGNEFEEHLNDIKQNLYDYILELTRVTEAFLRGEDTFQSPQIQEVDIWPIKLAIEQKTFSNNFKNLQPRLVHALERTHQAYLAQYISQLLEHNHPHNFIVLGEPGTGKTHGIAKAVENRLADNYPTLIIRAKGTPCDNWASILYSALGGLNQWTDSEIFSAMEALAVRADIYRALTYDSTEEVKNETTKVLIGIDGIDEVEDIKAWKIRINELREWIKIFPRLRFVVTSRSYVPSNTNPCDLDFDEHVNRSFDLPGDGDVPLYKLVPTYLHEYNIKYEDSPWILGAFENALSLKLFCEEYKGKDLRTISQKPVNFSLAFLLNAKIKSIETEFFDKHGAICSENEEIVKRLLFHIAETLITQSFIEHNELCRHLLSKLDNLLDRKLASKFLDTFIDHGIISAEKKIADDGISPPEIRYTITFQSYMDFFISIKATHEIVSSGSKKFPELLKSLKNWNIVRLTAISLLNDHNILIGEDNYWVDDLNPVDLQILRYEVLSNASSNVIKKYLPDIEQEFLQSPQKRNLILKHFILANLHRKELDLGFSFVHKILIKYSSTFERDLVWSGPAKYSEYDETDFGDILEKVHLFDFHTHRELPLVLAWSLTSVNNIYREHCRSELTHWAYKNIDEFIKLLDLVFFCGDPQVQEDLACIMLGIASLVIQRSIGLKMLAQWININIFSQGQIVNIRNSVIRHCARAVMERAYALGDCTKRELQRARPPYKANRHLLPLDTSGKSFGEGERYPIVHDLAWYVIKKSYKGFMDSIADDDTKHEMNDLLQKYSKAYNKDLTPYEFAISAGIAFIKNLGWQKVREVGMTEASHGSQSRLATFEEKYTWLAVHEIQGYLADLLQFRDDEDIYNKVPDYNLVLHVSNPVKENVIRYSDALEDQWYVPDDISPILNYTDQTLKEDIKLWVNRKDIPEFKPWVYVEGLRLNDKIKSPNKWVTLYIDTDFSEPNKIGRTFLGLICCLISKNQFNAFIKYFRENNNEVERLLFTDLDHFEAHPKSGTYTSVKDIVWMNWMKENYSEINLKVTSRKYIKILKTVTRAIENTLNDGEQYYKLPSKFLREELKIADTDKKYFFDSKKTLKALFSKTGRSYHEAQQLLIVDRESFNRFLHEKNLMPFWVTYQFQNTTLELRENHQDFHSQNSRFWLVWEEKGKINHHLYHDGYYTNEL